MELFIYSMTMLIAFAGGTVILARSGEKYGRILAFGLLFLSLFELCYLLNIIWNYPLWLLIASFFELACLCAFTMSVTSMERSIARKRPFVSWLSRSMIIICLIYGACLVFFPEAYLEINQEGYYVLGMLGKSHAAFILICGVIFIWIMENILRVSTNDQKRVLKYPALGIITVGVGFILSSMHRLSTISITHEILILSSLILLVGISFLIFFAIRFKLFEMDIFVSRYVVYHSITFLSIGAYLFAMGLIILGVQRMGLQLPFVTIGFFVVIVLLALGFLIISPEAKAHLRFFVDTHFFANKYDYRKEWGELSGYLSIAFNEKQIIHVTSEVILDSMYINELSIWIEDADFFRCVYSFPSPMKSKIFAKDEMFIACLEKNPYFLRKASYRTGDELWERTIKESREMLKEHKIELAVPMMAENRMIGFIAVGKENPGTPYGKDDIDLLSAIASQSSAALMSARFAQELAANKEMDAFNRMSAYVLHDLKNASGNLSLILQNAPKHIDNRDFQKDMIETVSETLARIDKVMGRLGSMPAKEELNEQRIHLRSVLDKVVSRLQPRLFDIKVIDNIENDFELITDPEMLEKILENIIVNSTEAISNTGEITIEAKKDGRCSFISIRDNGIGMSEDFIREKLFKPFQTTKNKGTGLGLWQVKNMVSKLGASIDVTSYPAQGVMFTITFSD
ncbi:MAG TPA: PEP-CTERM system histidine kinase PrsK [Deltaproteobacteria bacterium]|nr:PEP-CTERM system histidine kinase PrsK [Deltaproteobacteria bacterium]